MNAKRLSVFIDAYIEVHENDQSGRTRMAENSQSFNTLHHLARILQEYGKLDEQEEEKQ